jgi:hypothetical protein
MISGSRVITVTISFSREWGGKTRCDIYPVAEMGPVVRAARFMGAAGIGEIWKRVLLGAAPALAAEGALRGHTSPGARGAIRKRKNNGFRPWNALRQPAWKGPTVDRFALYLSG